MRDPSTVMSMTSLAAYLKSLGSSGNIVKG